MRSNQLRHRTARASQRGMTLIEAIVAIFVFTVVFLAALALYQSANRAYLRTDAATIQQQNVRFAMDRMMETLRDAGANYNPLGSTKLADEQIEGAWESAVFVRGDFDNAREDGTGGSQDLEDVTWPMVTTGNDEIVGFVLWKDGAGSQTLDLKFDMSAPRNALVDAAGVTSEEEPKSVRVAVKNLAEQTNPPYQLVKVTWNTAGEPVYEVLAENIFRMWFDYLPATGTTEVTPIAGTSADDTGRPTRKTIRRIGVTLIGMTDRADFGYTDPVTYTPAEGTGTKSYRKLSLSQTLLAVNLGRKGKRHYEVPATNIVSPDWIKACNGHCRRYRLSWPESATGGVQYEVSYAAPADAGSGLGAFEDTFTTSNLFWDFEEPAADQAAGVFRTWTFRVRAITGVEEGDWTTAVTRVGNVNNQSIPGTAEDVTAAQFSGRHAMALRWTAVTENEAPITDATCIDSLGNTSTPDDPWNVEFKDVADYKIYRVLSNGSNDGDDATTDVSEVDLGELKNDSTTAANFIDNTAAPCSSYFYRVKACDICGTTSADFSPAMPQDARIAPPEAGVNPGKPGTPTLVGALAYAAGNYTLTLTWPHLTRTSDSQLAAASHYVLEQWRRVDTVDSDFVHQPAQDMNIIENNVSSPITVPDTVGGNPTSYEFRVRGIYDCTSAEGGPRQGELSDPFTLGCTPSPSHTVELAAPPSGGTYVRPTDSVIPFQINVGGVDADWTGAKIEIKLGTTIVRTVNLSGAPSGGRYSVNHDTAGLDDGVYTAVAFASTTQGCGRYSTPISFELETLDCGLTFDDTTDDLIPATNATGLETQFQFKVTNSCATAVVLDGMKLIWSGGRNAAAYITKIQYNGVDVTAALDATTGASDTFIPFTTNVTVPASGTSSFFKVIYSARKDGTTWSSIQARHDDDESMDETLSAPIKQACAVDYDYSTDEIQPSTGSTRERQFRFRVNNPCGEDIVVDAINLSWGNTNTLTKIQYNGVDVTATTLTAASGTTLTFNSPITLPTGTSAYFRVFYSDRMSTTWSSVLFRHRTTQEFTEALSTGNATPTSGPVTSP